MNKELTLDEAEDALRIDADDLDTVLIRHAQLYHNIADKYELAVDRRDAIKLELEETLAELDGQVRRKAQVDEEKLTETALQNRIRSMPKVAELYRKHLEAKTRAGRWGALKAGFEQRSFMISKIVERADAQLFALGVERGTSSLRSRLGDQTKARITQARRERLGK